LSALLISGNDVAAAAKDRIRNEVEALAAQGRALGLATLLVGDDPASHQYVGYKHRDAQSVGISSIDVRLPDSATQDEVFAPAHGEAIAAAMPNARLVVLEGGHTINNLNAPEFNRVLLEWLEEMDIEPE